MLAVGEVAEVIVRPDVDIVTIVLQEGAIVKGRRMDHRTFHMNIIDTSNFEEKLRAAEQRLGIPPGRGVPVVYERNTDTAGRLLTTLIAVAVLISIISRMKGFKSPISMDMFVRMPSFSLWFLVLIVNFLLLYLNRVKCLEQNSL
jgi:spastic paraplegia protein 7